MRADSPPPADGDRHQEGADRGEPVDFGPSGYLPRRAADRARKIVLRERMARSWPIAAVLAGLVVLAAGTAFLLRGGPPEEPFIPVTALSDLAEADATVVAADGRNVLLVRAPGALRAFAPPDQPVRWCDPTDRLESRAGAVWRLDGRRVGGEAPSLTPLPSTVHRGVVYAAPRAPLTAPPPAGRDEQPGCPPP